MIKNNENFIDLNPIVIHFRDINGDRFSRIIKNVSDFNSYDWSWFDDEIYQILIVQWGDLCIYNALTDMEIHLEDLVGFFA